MREIVFEIAANSRNDVKRHGAQPVGEVRGIIVPGYGQSRYSGLGRGATRLVTELPTPVAERMVDFRDRYILRREGSYNCLGFMAFSGGRQIGIDELYRMTGPELVEGGYEDVKDVRSLKPGAEYGLPDSEGYLIHGVIGLAVPNRNVGVDQTRGQIKVTDTEQMVQEYLVNCGHPERLVELQPDGYQSSELVRKAQPVLV